MEFERLIIGRKHIVFSPYHRGVATIDKFIEGLGDKFQANLCDGLILNFSNTGSRKSNKYGKLGQGIFELKPGQNRFPYFYQPEDIAVITHGFIKKSQKTPRREILKAIEIQANWEKWRLTNEGRDKIRKAITAKRTG